jgi:hypothetical protein
LSNPLPPAGSGAQQWCDRVGILKFYEQLMNRDLAPRDEEFHDAWRLFTMKTYRRMAEGLYLAEVLPVEIRRKLEVIGVKASIGAVDVFFNEFFITRDFSENKLWEWVQGIGKYARDTSSIAYLKDWDSKQHALYTKLDVIGVLSRLGALTWISRADMIEEVRHRLFYRFIRFDSDLEMGTLSREELLRRMAQGGMMKGLSQAINEITKTQDVCKLLKVVEKRSSGLALLNSDDLMSREMLLEKDMLAKPKAQTEEFSLGDSGDGEDSEH